MFVYKGYITEEVLSQRWLSGLLEHNQNIYFVSVKTPNLRAVEHHTNSKSFFDPGTVTKSFSTPQHNSNEFWSLNWNQVKFDPLHWNQVKIDHPDKNQINFDAHTKTKRFAAPIQKPSQFRPPRPTQKPSQSIIRLETI